VRPLVLILAAGLVLSACGEAPRPASEPRVRLKLEAPNDPQKVRDDHVQVRGTVTPADATVQVGGAAAQVDGGEFTATVALQPGGNVIDVSATATGRRPATDAVRVTRDMSIEVPPLTGVEVASATAQLKKLGLEASENDGDSWLDRVLGGEVDVCDTQPAAGALVQPHTTITLDTSRNCPANPAAP
jgi:beta-lactam-binding protein with PASTA domain